MRSHNFACALTSAAFRIELNGLISPSVLGLVHSCVKLMAVEGGEVCKQVGDEGTSLRWLSYLAELSFSCSVVSGDQWRLGGQHTLTESTQIWERALLLAAGPYMGGLLIAFGWLLGTLGRVW